MKTIEELKKLNELIVNNEIGKAKYLWGGADVVVVKEQPKTNPNGFYPDPFFVVSAKFSLEISWMFEQLRDAFYAEKLLDGCSKIEFFGRLARAANRGILKNEEDCCVICMEILNEAQQIYGEITSNTFEVLPIGTGNIIADDLKKAYTDSFETIRNMYSDGLVIGRDTKPIDFAKGGNLSLNNQNDSGSWDISDAINWPESVRNNFIVSFEIERLPASVYPKYTYTIIEKKTNKKITLHVVPTAFLYSKKYLSLREELISKGINIVVTTKRNYFSRVYNTSIAFIISKKTPTSEVLFSTVDSPEELADIIFDEGRFKRKIFFASSIDSNNLLPENYSYEKKNLSSFIDSFNPKKLEDIAEIIPGANPVWTDYSEDRTGIPLLSSGSIKNGKIVKCTKFIREENYKKFSRQLLQSGDILITKLFGQNKICIVDDDMLPAIASNFLYIIRPLGLADFNIYEYLSNNAGKLLFKKQLDEVSTKGTIQSISLSALKQLKIPQLRKEDMSSFEMKYNENFSDIQAMAKDVIEKLSESKIEDEVFDSLLKAGWKIGEISRDYNISYDDNKALRADFVLFDNKEPVAFIEVKSSILQIEQIIQQIKCIQKQKRILALISLGQYYEAYKYDGESFSVHKFFSAPTKADLIRIVKEDN